MSNENIKNTEWRVPASTIAGMVGCSSRMVNMVRAGLRGKRNGQLVERIQVAEILVDDKKNLLLQEVKHVVNF